MVKEHRFNHSGVSRRHALKSLASGFGYLAFASLAHEAAAKEGKPRSAGSMLGPTKPHFPARAKRIIFLCMNGGPSHVDLFDYKPSLNSQSGNATTIGRDRGGAKLFGSPFEFSQHGESGLWVSEVCPQLAKHVDDVCFLHSMHTGSFQFVRPSIGAWTLYGLGSENENLPGFLTLNPPSDNGGARNYGSGFLPAICQGSKIGGNQIPEFYAKLLGKDEEPGPVFKNIENTATSRQQQREQLNLIRSLNARKLERDVYHPEIEGAIESFELAVRMQDEVPEVLDIRSEPESIRKLYGVGQGRVTDRFGRQCLLARRLAEAGVRFIEVTAPTSWDHHFMLQDKLAESCAATDQPVAALLADLKQRGMFEDTLVIWAGEFGRTPYAQSGHGRDHNNKGYTIWMAGGGVKGGFAFGATDEFGYRAVEHPVHIHDWHATILHLLGLDHERLTFDYAGREYRLTDVHGDVVTEILA
jgi:hypothetical protein